MGLISGFTNILTKSLGIEQLKKQTKGIRNIAADLATVEKAKREESFEIALKRLNLTEADIQQREKEFTRLVMIFSFIGIGLVLYLIYSLIQKSLITSVGTFGIILFVVAQLFRYHFWLFQIRQRKLGCTFKEWFYALVGKRS